MRIVPLSVKDAEEFLESHGRHYTLPAEPICAIGVAEEMIDLHANELKLHGAAILGRVNGDGALAHIYVDGVSQGYTLLYGACWRALKALGYEKTYL